MPYLIPPNKHMSILHGVLHLLDPVAPRGPRLPIDFFFRSVARANNDLKCLLASTDIATLFGASKQLEVELRAKGGPP